MAEIKKLAVEDRQEIGKRRNRRLRKAGKIPAVLYGHKKDVVSLSLSADEVTAVIRRGDRFVALTGPSTKGYSSRNASGTLGGRKSFTLISRA